MSHIKVSELFYSIQGEGRYMGVPSVFLRTFGCNFTCGGFGMPKGQVSNERNEVSISKISNYKELPLVSTGCDSYASWDPRFKHLSPVLNIHDIVESMLDILPGRKWNDVHLVITGGEPLLGWQRAYPELLSNSNMVDLTELTFETNGTQKLTPQFASYLSDWNKVGREITFSVSPKLSVSGEAWSDAIQPEIISEYQEVGYVYLKFVVANEEDAAEAESAVNEYRKAGFDGPVYLMPVGGIESVYSMNNKKVAELAMKMGYRYSDRLHVPLWKNAHGT